MTAIMDRKILLVNPKSSLVVFCILFIVCATTAQTHSPDWPGTVLITSTALPSIEDNTTSTALPSTGPNSTAHATTTNTNGPSNCPPFNATTASNKDVGCSLHDSLTFELVLDCVKCHLEALMAMVAEFGQILKETFAQDNEEQKFQEYLEKVDAVVKLKESINNSTENATVQVSNTLKFVKLIENDVLEYSRNVANTSKRGDNQSVEAPALSNFITAGFGQWNGGHEIRYPKEATVSDSFIVLERGWDTTSSIGNDTGDYVGVTINATNITNTPLAESIPQLLNAANITIRKGMTINSDFITLSLRDENKGEVKVFNATAEVNLKHHYPALKSNLVGFRGRRINASKPESGLCVYFENDTLKKEGCKTSRSTKDATTCKCNKLRSFLLLMDLHDVGNEYGLELLTNILCPLSSICLVLVITIFTLLKAIRTQQLAITRHLCCAILPGKLLLLTFVDRNFLGMEMHDGVCLGFALAAHYSYLAAFCWMGIEGVHFYFMTVSVYGAMQSRMKIYRFVGYCAPAVIIALVCAVGYLVGDVKPYVNESFCWLNGVYMWSFLGPAALVVVVNGVMLVISLNAIFKSQPQSENEIQRNRSNRKLVLGIFGLATVLGLGWIWGFFIFMPSQEASLTFAYIFVILNGSQGMFIFFFQCVLDDKVRSNLAKLLTRKTTFAALSTTDQTTKTTAQISISAPAAGTSYEKQPDDSYGYHEWEPGYVKIVRKTETTIETY